MLFCLFAFVALLSAAMALYPGGNFLDRRAIGHRFFANFLCDLTQPMSLSGVPNSFGAGCAQVGMLCFAVALLGFFWLLPRYFAPGARVKRWAFGLGVCSVLSFVAVPLTPSERFGNVHAVLSLMSGSFGIASAALAVRALFRAERQTLAVLGVSSLIVGTIDSVLFACQLGDSAPPPLIVPAAQKIAAVLVSAWIATAAVGVLIDDSTLAGESDDPVARG